MANSKSRKHKCTPYLKDEDQLAKIVKQHIKDELDPSKNQLLWQGRTDEGVLENYQDFLTAVAQLGHYLDKTMLFKVVRKQFIIEMTSIMRMMMLLVRPVLLRQVRAHRDSPSAVPGRPLNLMGAPKRIVRRLAMVEALDVS